MTGTFSPSEAAFSVFDLARRHTGFVVRYCAATTIVMLLLGLMASGTGLLTKMADLQAMAATGNAITPERFAAWAEDVNWLAATAFFATFFASWVVLSAAALRKTVRDEELGFGGLQFGRDEVNFMVASLAVGLLAFGALFAVSFIGGVLGLLAPQLAILGAVGSVMVFIVLVGRICQYGVLTIAESRPVAFASWSVTKDVFWRFVGAHILWFALYSLIALIVQAVLGALTGAAGAGAQHDIAAFLSPGRLLMETSAGLLQGFGTLGSVCVGAYAWHQMRGQA